MSNSAPHARHRASLRRALSPLMSRSPLFPISRLWALASAPLTLGACHSPAMLKTVAQVDLQRFMGDWYVIASIPTYLEKDAHNAVESYALAEDGTIETTFTFNEGAFDGPVKTYRPRGFVHKGTGNAVWGMQFVWPIKAEYLITYLSDDYTTTIISRTRRDYVWIMARTPTLPEDQYQRLATVVAAQGYDISRLRRVPQTPNSNAAPKRNS